MVKYPVQKEEHTQVDRLPSVTTDKRLRTETVAVGQEQVRSHVLKTQSVCLSVCVCLPTLINDSDTTRNCTDGSKAILLSSLLASLF